jgi:hypothetical protein
VLAGSSSCCVRRPLVTSSSGASSLLTVIPDIGLASSDSALPSAPHPFAQPGSPASFFHPPPSSCSRPSSAGRCRPKASSPEPGRQRPSRARALRSGSWPPWAPPRSPPSPMSSAGRSRRATPAVTGRQAHSVRMPVVSHVRLQVADALARSLLAVIPGRRPVSCNVLDHPCQLRTPTCRSTSSTSTASATRRFRSGVSSRPPRLRPKARLRRRRRRPTWSASSSRPVLSGPLLVVVRVASRHNCRRRIDPVAPRLLSRRRHSCGCNSDDRPCPWLKLDLV